MSSDLRRALRLALARKGDWLLLVATLACGIVAPTVALSVADAVIWHPLPFRDADRLVRVSARVAPAIVRESPGARAVFTGLYPFALDAATIDAGGGADAVTIGELSPGLIEALGVTPARGRAFAADEFTSPSQVVIVNAALGALLRAQAPDRESWTLRVDGVRQTVVGIMPEGFDFPVGRVALWRPLVETPVLSSTRALGVLKPGISVAALTPTVTGAWPADAHVTPFALVSSATLTGVGTLVGAALLLFLIAMVNAGGLHVAAAVGREDEFAVRASLGASAGQLARAVLVEGGVATAVAGLVAVPLASWAIAGVVRAVPYLIAFQTLRPIVLDSRALMASIGATAIVGALASWASFARMRRLDLQSILRAQNRSLRSHGRARQLLSVTGIAVTVPIVVCAALLFNSLFRLVHVDPGFPTDRILQLVIDLPHWKYADEASVRHARARLRDALGDLPAVESVSIADGIPPALDRRALSDLVVDGAAAAAVAGFVSYDAVDDRFFQTLGIRILAGRAFDVRDAEGSESVAVVSQSFAERLWPGANALGRRFAPSRGARERTVVGVAADVTSVDADRTRGTFAFYLPAAQSAASSMTHFIVHTRTAPMSATRVIEDTARRVLPDAPVIDLGTVADLVADDAGRERFLAGVVGVIAAAGLGLALVGVYATFWASVRERTREIGVRLALGASPAVVFRSVLGSSARVALAGLAIGLPLAYLATRALAAWLFQISPSDPITYAAATIGVVVASVAATVGPARRAASLDPVRALADLG